MTEFEKHVRAIAEHAPGLSVKAAILFAEARMAGRDDPLPNPGDYPALAEWARGLTEVMQHLPHKPINAIKELRAAGHSWGLQVGLREAKGAVDILRGQIAPAAFVHTPHPRPSKDRHEGGGHEFLPVAGHPDDDECTYREDGTDATYCGEPREWHEVAP